MESKDCFKNLRMLAAVDKGEYLSTDGEGNIISIIQDGMWNKWSFTIWNESWDSNLAALSRIFILAVPSLLEKKEDATQLNELLINSKEGLENLKVMFSEAKQVSHIDRILERANGAIQ